MPSDRRPRRPKPSRGERGASSGPAHRPRPTGDATGNDKTPGAQARPAANWEAQRKARVRANKQRSRLVWMLMGGASIALLVAIIAYGVMNATKPQPGVTTPDDGSTHIAGRLPIAQTNLKPYSTDPPTSGPHWGDTWAAKGIYQQAPDEQVVHSLEHGYVVMHMNCSASECPDLYNQMKDIYLKYDKKIVLNYRPQTKARIALTAWTRLDEIQASELPKNEVGQDILSPELKDRITRFIGAYREKIGPELGAP